MDILYDDALSLILIYLTPKDLAKFKRISKRWKRIIENLDYCLDFHMDPVPIFKPLIHDIRWRQSTKPDMWRTSYIFLFIDLKRYGNIPIHPILTSIDPEGKFHCKHNLNPIKYMYGRVYRFLEQETIHYFVDIIQIKQNK